jgi:hypothetical protein
VIGLIAVQLYIWVQAAVLLGCGIKRDGWEKWRKEWW